MSNPQTFCLFKRSNGVYYIKYSHNGTTRWKSTGCTFKKDALRSLTEFEQLRRDTAPSVSLARFVDDYLAYSWANHTSGTHEICSSILKRFLAFVGDSSLKAINSRHADEYKSHRLMSIVTQRRPGAVAATTRKKLSPVTVNIELRTLRAAFSVAVRWKLINTSPFDGIQLARIPECAPSFISKTDFERLLAMVREQWLKELMIFSVATGMRRGEVLHLRWTDVDLSRRLVHVVSNATHRTKSGKRRTIPMSNLAAAILNAKAGRTLSEYVFTRRGRQIGESYLTHKFKKYIRLAGLSENLHWHSLRHTHASWLVQDGASLYEVQKLLGHSSSRVTEVYSHLQPEQLHSTVNRIQIQVN